MSTDAGPGSKQGVMLDVEHSEKLAQEETVVTGDYSGAEEKTDPVEIALVRKLDPSLNIGNSSTEMLYHKLDLTLWKKT
ncbi:uncharacterized protein ColSpa_12815 [Colletotrichum spaethianum]|uniref:Uncharacterized protein n=1 Tax=Colletotrichum spaethianum TaxID=700344 RepID=A0AA37ULD5_9PEZI|nr:uncharacterized protein ColSpa_12815 [Colletotrichum spaethianum]GKT52634.1 hypothetical protein ColSpa_12815 [Colletotrichum spaethianum]